MATVDPVSSEADEVGQGGNDEERVHLELVPCPRESTFDQAYAVPKGCTCGSFGCDDVSIDVVAAHLGIPVHPLAELIGDHLTRLEAALFEANYRNHHPCGS